MNIVNKWHIYIMAAKCKLQPSTAFNRVITIRYLSATDERYVKRIALIETPNFNSIQTFQKRQLSLNKKRLFASTPSGGQYFHNRSDPGGSTIE